MESVLDVYPALSLVPRSEALAQAARGTADPGWAGQRVATYPARLALSAMATRAALDAAIARVSARLRSTRRRGHLPYVLDVGCGPGYASHVLADRLGARVAGIDAGPEMIVLARSARHMAGPGPGVRPATEFRLADVTHGLPFTDGAFDVVWAGDFWARGMDDEVARVLAPGGVLVHRSTMSLGWRLADDPGLTRRLATAIATGHGRAMAQGTGDRPGGCWQRIDRRVVEVTHANPMPLAAEEFIVQDLAAFSGRFLADAAESADWARVTALFSPAAAMPIFTRPRAEFHASVTTQIYLRTR